MKKLRLFNWTFGGAKINLFPAWRKKILTSNNKLEITVVAQLSRWRKGHIQHILGGHNVMPFCLEVIYEVEIMAIIWNIYRKVFFQMFSTAMVLISCWRKQEITSSLYIRRNTGIFDAFLLSRKVRNSEFTVGIFNSNSFLPLSQIKHNYFLLTKQFFLTPTSADNHIWRAYFLGYF